MNFESIKKLLIEELNNTSIKTKKKDPIFSNRHQNFLLHLLKSKLGMSLLVATLIEYEYFYRKKYLTPTELKSVPRLI